MEGKRLRELKYREMDSKTAIAMASSQQGQMGLQSNGPIHSQGPFPWADFGKEIVIAFSSLGCHHASRDSLNPMPTQMTLVKPNGRQNQTKSL